MKKLAYDTMQTDTLQVIQDTKCCLKVAAVLSKAGVYQYEDGMAYKSPMELLKATRTAYHAKLTIGDHPKEKVIMRQVDLYGGIEKPYFDRGKMRGLLSFDKYVTPKNKLDMVRQAVTEKTPLDVSIGFYYTLDPTPGTANDVNTGKSVHYDYAMQDIMIDHVVVVTDSGRQGRCTFPNCGIGVDAMMQNLRIDVNRGEKMSEKDLMAEEFVKLRVKEGIAEEEARLQYAELVKEPEKDSKPLKMDEPYPWDQCVTDRMAEGHDKESADAICAAIKNSTVSHASTFYGIKDMRKAVDFVLSRVKTDKLFAYNLAQAAKRFEEEAKKPTIDSKEVKEVPVTPPTQKVVVPPPRTLTVDEQIEHNKNLMRLREQKVIEQQRQERRHPL